MAYNEFTLESFEARFGIRSRSVAVIPPLADSPPPDWLLGQLERGRSLAITSEKARCELLVMPILMAARELCGRRFSILSGHRFDVDPVQRLIGECDFLLTLSDPVPVVRSPVVALVEAKKQDMEAGQGQCAAQMLAAQLFNERAGEPMRPVFGCVTTGDDWQFLRLTGNALEIDPRLRFGIEVGGLLAAFRYMVEASTN